MEAKIIDCLSSHFEIDFKRVFSTEVVLEPKK